MIIRIPVHKQSKKNCIFDYKRYLEIIYLFNNIYTVSKYQLQKLFFQQSPV